MGQNQSSVTATGLVAAGAAIGLTVGLAISSRTATNAAPTVQDNVSGPATEAAPVVQDNPQMDQYAVVPGSMDQADDAMRLVKKAEFVLRQRTQRILAVIENCTDDINHVAVMRSCEALGIQNVWLVEAPITRTENPKANKPKWQKRLEKNDPNYDPLLGTKRAQVYASHLDVRRFKTTGCG